MSENVTNIVFILTDDQGPWALGSINEEIRTPHLDRLTAEGVRFENFFCTSPVCSPARASLLTGRIPSQHGVHDWIAGGNTGRRTTEGASSVEEQEPIEYLAGQPGYTDVLSDAGYRCGISGKWHLGGSQVAQKSFDHWFVTPEGAGSFVDPRVVRGDDVDITVESGYLSEIITNDAIAFIDRESKAGRPFYCSVHYTAPHSPWLNQHPKEYLDLYDDCAFSSCPQEPVHPGMLFSDFQFSKMIAGIPQDQPIAVDEFLKGYFASVTAMDAQIGRIIDRLDALGLRESTLIFFLSDNGFNCGHHGIWGKGNSTFPLNLYDTSVKVPAIASHPGRIPAGRVVDSLVSGYDVAPTLLEYVGLQMPGDPQLPGRSLVSLLEGGESNSDEFVVVYDEYGPNRMIRTKEWKYIHRHPYGPHELYDLISDPGESRNLLDPVDERDYGHSLGRTPEIARRLKADLDSWFLLYADPSVDGAREGVSGRGQLTFAGPRGKGLQAWRARRRQAYG